MIKGKNLFIRPPAETRPLRAGYFKNNVGPSTKLGPNLIPGLKAWVHFFLSKIESKVCVSHRSAALRIAWL